MSHAKLTNIIVLALLLLTGRAQAQVPQAQRTADPELQKRAIDLLRTVADQIGTLQSAENRARFGSNIAASLWKHDEQRARTLLSSVQSDINFGLQNVDDDERIASVAPTVFLKLRMDTVERIARHDAEAALAFLKATEPGADLPKSGEMAEIAFNMEVRLANQIARENPDVAIQLGRKSLAYGFSTDLLHLLRLLQRKDKAKALAFYKEIVAALVSTGLLHHSGVDFATRLTRSFTPPVVDEQTFRQLVNLFIDTAFQNGCHKPIEEGTETSNFCYQLGLLVSQMEKVDASRGAQLKKWASSDQSDSQSLSDGYQELHEISVNGTVDEVLALAVKYPQMEHAVYWRAIALAEESGDIDRARKLATAHLHEAERKELIARLDRAEAWQSLTAEKMGDIQEAISKIPHALERVSFLLLTANQLGARDRKTSLKLLGQANEIIDTVKPGRVQTAMEMGLAMMYCLEKDQRGLDRMQSMMPKLNELIGAAIKLDGYESYNVRDGEWNMSNEGSIGSMLTELSQGAVYFAWCDFDRAVNLAGQFERSEIRLMAQLKLAQAILAGPPKRPPGVWTPVF